MLLQPDLFIASHPREHEGVNFLNDLFYNAVINGASDLHFQFHNRKGCRIRRRIGTVLEDVNLITSDLAQLIDIKIRSKGNIAASDRLTPISSTFPLRWPEEGKEVKIRLEIIPTADGQLFVCRLGDQDRAGMPLSEIQMTDAVRWALDVILSQPEKLFVISGPVGSGKTTTLYAVIGEINSPDIHIITIENPVEYSLPGLSQINVDGHHMTFGKAVRSGLRLDFNAALLGEVRDSETAALAVEYSNVGRFILTSTHANSSATTPDRFIKLGVDSVDLASALNGIMAQRLVRRIAPDAQVVWEEPNGVEKEWLTFHGIDFAGKKFPKIVEGGYSGVIPLIELIVVNEDVRKAIECGSSEQHLLDLAAHQIQFETLAQAGGRLAMAGLTTLSQAMKVVKMDCLRPRYKRVDRLLVTSGAITQDQATTAISQHIELRKSGVIKSVGQILLEDGLITKEELEAAQEQESGFEYD
jgi:type II secretory ATPase GspE/PulE/Tfp pilus assembly ATPase PilB-like protein